jgi:hypothetical protein
MTAERWSADQLGALADEWVAEREAFLSALHAYLATHLSQNSCPTTATYCGDGDAATAIRAPQ